METATPSVWDNIPGQPFAWSTSAPSWKPEVWRVTHQKAAQAWLTRLFPDMADLVTMLGEPQHGHLSIWVSLRGGLRDRDPAAVAAVMDTMRDRIVRMGLPTRPLLHGGRMIGFYLVDDLNATSPSRVASRHNRANSDEIMDQILPRRDLVKLTRSMSDDQATASIATDVWFRLAERLTLSETEKMALNRLRNSIRAVGQWDAETQRNNLFKAADLLGMRLPHGVF